MLECSIIKQCFSISKISTNTKRRSLFQIWINENWFHANQIHPSKEMVCHNIYRWSEIAWKTEICFLLTSHPRFWLRSVYLYVCRFSIYGLFSGLYPAAYTSMPGKDRSFYIESRGYYVIVFNNSLFVIKKLESSFGFWGS